MTLALRFQLARELSATKDTGSDWTSQSPLFYQIRSNISIGFALLQLAQTSLLLNRPLDERVLARAERAYAKSMGYVEQLPQDERTPAAFNLARLRAALDDFHSAQTKHT